MFRTINQQILFQKTVETMNMVEKENKGLSGLLKKKYVLQLLEHLITQQYGQETWLDNEDLVESFIEIIIQISHKEILLNINKQIRECCY